MRMGRHYDGGYRLGSFSETKPRRATRLARMPLYSRQLARLPGILLWRLRSRRHVAREIRQTLPYRTDTVKAVRRPPRYQNQYMK